MKPLTFTASFVALVGCTRAWTQLPALRHPLAHRGTRQWTLCATPEVVDLSSLVDKYDALLLDQFGVLHDGKQCYEGSAEAIRKLQEAGMRIIILSNSSKRRRDTVDRLHALQCGMCTWLDQAEVAGVPLISVCTSGDLVHKGLTEAVRGEETVLATHPIFNDLNGVSRAFVFGNGDDDQVYLRAAGLLPASVDQADIVLARGLFCTVGGDEPVDFDAAAVADGSADALLAAAAERGLPMIVANPDLVRPDGKDSPMPGVLGARYADHFGGDVRFVGKPHPLIYQVALKALSDAGVTDASRIAAVGDSMHHDVAGARAAGIDAVFVAWGVHAAELGLKQGKRGAVDASKLERFLSAFPEDERPTATVPGFVL